MVMGSNRRGQRRVSSGSRAMHSRQTRPSKNKHAARHDQSDRNSRPHHAAPRYLASLARMSGRISLPQTPLSSLRKPGSRRANSSTSAMTASALWLRRSSSGPAARTPSKWLGDEASRRPSTSAIAARHSSGCSMGNASSSAAVSTRTVDDACGVDHRWIHALANAEGDLSSTGDSTGVDPTVRTYPACMRVRHHACRSSRTTPGTDGAARDQCQRVDPLQAHDPQRLETRMKDGHFRLAARC